MNTSITTTMTSTSTIHEHGGAAPTAVATMIMSTDIIITDDVFTSWGKGDTSHKFERAKLEEILKQFVEDDKILRSKGMVEGTDGKWIYF